MLRRRCALTLLIAPFAFSQNPPDSKATPPRVSNKKRSEPEYSEQARRDHISGTVELKATVGADGHVRDIEVVRGLGHGLDENAIKAVRTWEFEPATKDGVPTEGTVPINCEFHTL